MAIKTKYTDGAIPDVSIQSLVDSYKFTAAELSFEEFCKMVTVPKYVETLAPDFIDLGPFTATKLTNKTEDEEIRSFKSEWENGVAETVKKTFDIDFHFYCEPDGDLESYFEDLYMVAYVIKLKSSNKMTSMLGLIRKSRNLSFCSANGRLEWSTKSFIGSRLFYAYVLLHPREFGVTSVQSTKTQKVHNLIVNFIKKDYDASSESIKQLFDELSPTFVEEDFKELYKNLWYNIEQIRSEKLVVWRWDRDTMLSKFQNFEAVVEMANSLWREL